MKNISVFANFFINDKERYLRTIDSFKSFEKANIEKWIINTRGKYSDNLKNYLRKKIKQKLIFSRLDSGNWFEDTKKLLRYIDTKLVFLWTEDHINISGHNYFNNIVQDMIKYNIDYLEYSWFFKGIKLRSYKNHPHKETGNIIYLNYDSKILKKRLKFYKNNGSEKLFDYIIAHQSIQKKDLFIKLINKNKFGFFRKHLPFSLEKNKRFKSWLPYKIGVVKKEFFVSIDDDGYCRNYCLINRGTYPDRLSDNEKKKIRDNRQNDLSRYNIYGYLYYSKIMEKIKNFFRFFN
tara:strand:- start:1482 stop:2357 length:876 start_codon:yes stop_codon:yes gene_type:complete